MNPKTNILLRDIAKTVIGNHLASKLSSAGDILLRTAPEDYGYLLAWITKCFSNDCRQ
ncbi:MAG TPA: hypothetical protein VE955_10075 [Candidatus Dormibacteraeota bacterium]|nr:hypothetical protein [Candidatus Dormibacteraeota bacterium]